MKTVQSLYREGLLSSRREQFKVGPREFHLSLYGVHQLKRFRLGLELEDLDLAA
jgi:hypothetical protein